MPVHGNPGETVGRGEHTVKVADVVAILAPLPEGFVTRHQVQLEYVRKVGISTDQELKNVSRVVTALTLQSTHMEDYQIGWTIRPDSLRQRWPRHFPSE